MNRKRKPASASQDIAEEVFTSVSRALVEFRNQKLKEMRTAGIDYTNVPSEISNGLIRVLSANSASLVYQYHSENDKRKALYNKLGPELVATINRVIANETRG